MARAHHVMKIAGRSIEEMKDARVCNISMQACVTRRSEPCNHAMFAARTRAFRVRYERGCARLR